MDPPTVLVGGDKQDPPRVEETSAFDPEGCLSEDQLKKKRKRRRVAQELLETEVAYVANLELLKEAFYEPLHQNSLLKEPGAVISTDDVRTIFGSLNIILPVNKLLLVELQKRLAVPETDYLLIGEAFKTLVRTSSPPLQPLLTHPRHTV
jgi:hypothetical protein